MAEPQRRLGRWGWAAVLIWPVLMLPGFAAVEWYATAPGRLADPPASWPAAAGVERNHPNYTVVMLAHPWCPCTRASLRELGRLMAQIDGHAEAIVLFADPEGTDWNGTGLWSLAEGIPGARVLADRDGALADTFGAYTSGQVVVYDRDDALVFNGGITRARGHDGDNQGRMAIAEIVLDGSAATATADVFGCELDSPDGGAP